MNNWQTGDTVFVTRGAHGIKTGFDFQRIQFNQHTTSQVGGLLTFTSLSNFLQGIPSQFDFALPGGVDPDRGYRQSLAAFFAQDDIRVRSNLVLNLGLRYEFAAVPTEVMRRAKAAGIKSVPTGIEHGTVTLVVEAQPVEVTTLREDIETFGRKAKVVFGRDCRVPRVADVHQIARRCTDWRDPRRRGGAPRQNRRAPVDPRMCEPRFCGCDLARRRKRATRARELAGDCIRSLVPRQRDLTTFDLVRLTEIEERR